MYCRYHLIASTALLSAWMLTPQTAAAQSVSEAEKIDRLERQTCNQMIPAIHFHLLQHTD